MKFIQKNKEIFVLILFGIFIFILGCSAESKEPNIVGYVLEAKENELLVAKNITPEEYDDIKNTSIDKLYDEKLSLIHVSYVDERNFKKGNEIEVWLDGDIRTTYPEQADANKIELKE